MSASTVIDERDVIGEIETVVCQDVNGRQIDKLLCIGDLYSAAKALQVANRIAIVTGFYVAAIGVGETDGPPGAIALATGLRSLGKHPVLVTDHFNMPLVTAGLNALPSRQGIGLIDFPLEEPEAFAATVMDEAEIDHLVFIERVGPAVDGRCYNAFGRDITDFAARTDHLLHEAVRRGVETIGIGDGGNEVGMGKVHDRVVDHVSMGAQVGCVLATDSLIAADVSNWGAWALLAALSILEGQDVLPDDRLERDVLTALVDAGAVDARTNRPEMTIDGIGFDDHVVLLDRLRTIVERMIGADARP